VSEWLVVARFQYHGGRYQRRWPTEADARRSYARHLADPHVKWAWLYGPSIDGAAARPLLASREAEA
jgi:hypothetical protein